MVDVPVVQHFLHVSMAVFTVLRAASNALDILSSWSVAFNNKIPQMFRQLLIDRGYPSRMRSRWADVHLGLIRISSVSLMFYAAYLWTWYSTLKKGCNQGVVGLFMSTKTTKQRGNVLPCIFEYLFVRSLVTLGSSLKRPSCNQLLQKTKPKQIQKPNRL